jgi:hypothetical protein
VPVTVRFAVRTPPSGFAEEPPDASALAGLPFHDWYGRLLLASGGAQVFVEDDLTALVASCFQAAAQLAAGENFGAYVNRYPGEYAIDIVDGTARLSGGAVIGPGGSGNADLAAPAGELAAGLCACGDRVLSLLESVLGDEPGRAETLAALGGLRTEAREALERAAG